MINQRYPTFCGFFGLMAILSTALDARELKVGIGLIDYPPYYFEKKDGVMAGAVYEIVQHVALELGHSLVFQRYPWPRIQSYLLVGNIDMVMVFFKTAEREKYVLYTETAHIYDNSYLVANKSAQIKFDGDLNRLGQFKFGNVRGYSHKEKYDRAVMLDKYEAGDEKQLIRMLLKGRIDLAVGNKAVMSVHAQHYKVLDQLDFLFPPIDRAPVFVAFSRAKSDAKELAQQFSIEIKKLLVTEKYQAILKKYQFEQ